MREALRGVPEAAADAATGLVTAAHLAATPGLLASADERRRDRRDSSWSITLPTAARQPATAQIRASGSAEPLFEPIF